MIQKIFQVTYICYLYFLAKITVEGLLEDTKVGEIIVPPSIYTVINTSCPQASDFARPGKHVCWIVYDYWCRYFLIFVHVCKCVGDFISLYIVWSLQGEK